MQIFLHLQGQYSTLQIEWKVPDIGSVNCNTNGVLKGFFRDESGAWLGGFGWNLGSCSMLTLKLWGIYSTLQQFLRWFQSLFKIYWATCYHVFALEPPTIYINESNSIVLVVRGCI